MSSVNKKIRINPAVPVGARVEHIHWYTHTHTPTVRWSVGGRGAHYPVQSVVCVSEGKGGGGLHQSSESVSWRGLRLCVLATGVTLPPPLFRGTWDPPSEESVSCRRWRRGREEGGRSAFASPLE